MNNDHYVLNQFSRAVCAAAASMCFIAAFALTPTEVRSRFDEPAKPRSTAAEHPLPRSRGIIAPARDPFVARAGDDEPTNSARPVATLTLPPINLGPLPANAGAGRFPFVRVPAAVTSRITAIALGDHPSAIAETTGGARLVSIGDALDGSTVAAIDRAGLQLQDGKRLRLPETTP